MCKSVKIIFMLIVMCFMIDNSAFAKGVMDVNEFVVSQNLSPQLLDVEIPEIISHMKSPTSNSTGYIFHIKTPIAEAFLENECHFGKQVIDIGAGFSNIPIEALKKGISEYVVNDISEEHLKIFVKKAMMANTNSELSNLRLLHGKVPDVLTEITGKYDAILADKILHFLSPNEINDFVVRSKSILTEGGRIYATVGSIYSIIIQNDICKKEYLQNLKDGKEFPGYYSNVMSRFNESDEFLEKFVVPEHMTFFRKEDLENLFEKHSMKIINFCYLEVPVEGETEWKISYDHGECIGIIAEKC